MSKQWGHGFHTGKIKGRQEASILFGAVGLTCLAAKKGYEFFEKKYPEKISVLKKTNILKNRKS